MLKRQGNVDFVVSIVSIVIYFSISIFMVWESWRTLAAEEKRGRQDAEEGPRKRTNRPSMAIDHDPSHSSSGR